MAPSPTGQYHIGHIRTLLYNFAWAKKHQGQFLLRIEDTDQERYVEGATDKILDVITAYGFTWDEGPRVGGPYKPYVQSERLDIYKNHAQQLIANDKAYYCFCSKDRLEKLRQEQQATGKLPGYDRLCRNLSGSEVKAKLGSQAPYVIRLKVPDNKQISFEDTVMGKISVNPSSLDDQILLKSDGFPTYHLAVVVDDHLMDITHVIRGNEWISSTPKHILLYEAFGWQPPIHAHLPIFLDPEGPGKMSKRKGSASAQSFLDAGYLPEAVLNYLMLLGWNPGTNQEIFTLSEFIKAFDVKDLNKANPRFTYDKLNWFNQEYLRALDNKTLCQRLRKFTKRSEEEIMKVLPLVKDRLTTLADFDQLTDYFFVAPSNQTRTPAKDWLQHALVTLEEKFDGRYVEEKARAFCAQNNIKVGDYFMALRQAVTGRLATPPLWDVMKILGKEETIRRLATSH